LVEKLYQFGPADGSSNGIQSAMNVAVFGLSGLTNA
jgi:hypothetical protein